MVCVLVYVLVKRAVHGGRSHGRTSQYDTASLRGLNYTEWLVLDSRVLL